MYGYPPPKIVWYIDGPLNEVINQNEVVSVQIVVVPANIYARKYSIHLDFALITQLHAHPNSRPPAQPASADIHKGPDTDNLGVFPKQLS
jgi:hypothetical protein